MSLLVKEVVRTIQGEGVFSGYPCALVRLSGCNLRCSFCDTTYAYEGGKEYTIEALLKKIMSTGESLILVTGGEPLFQKESKALLNAIVRSGLKVILETNGSLPIKGLPREVHIVMDIKCPASGQDKANYWTNMKFLKPEDEIKFVICDRKDYQWAKSHVKKHSLLEKAIINFSPAYGKLDPKNIASWIIKDKLHVRMNIQLHKIMGVP